MTTTPTSAPDPGVTPDSDTSGSVTSGSVTSGSVTSGSVTPAAGARTIPLAILALIAAFFVPLAAILIGHLALAQTKRTGEPGHTVALIGTILGYLFTAIIVIVVMLVAVVPLVLHTGTPTYSKF
jgi:hypothetical protein